MARKTDEGRRAEARRLYGMKISPARIAELLGVNRRTVQRWLGDDARPVGAPKNPAVPDAKIIELREHQGLSYDRIAVLTGMSVTGVRNRYWSLTGRQRADRRKPHEDAAAAEVGRRTRERQVSAMGPQGAPGDVHRLPVLP